MTLNETPLSNRLHIGIFGKRNSGKSSLLNALAGQETAIVSEIPGTTTDPVKKSLEIHGLGPCVIIDTAGFDDVGELGKKRTDKTLLESNKVDIAILVIADDNLCTEKDWYESFIDKKTPVITVINKIDCLDNVNELTEKVDKELKSKPIPVSASTGEGIKLLIEMILRSIPEDFEKRSITKDFVSNGDIVMLVMPQDVEAPKGRLILPQAQTIRELLDKECIIVSCTPEKMQESLDALKNPPKLIITDSQAFKEVYRLKPKESILTSFSILFAGLKGDLSYYVNSAKAIDSLDNSSHVLIAECCTHAPIHEDIGRVKLPALLRKQAGADLKVTVVSGTDFPKDLSSYDLIIQCGGCMFNRKYVMSRIMEAIEQKIPMTNYGVALAYLNGIAIEEVIKIL